ncbi:MAG TPA: VWA domain-containing protein [Baekduia sp.]|nr:VWA domain-containing protein [Baekduia sp.]
MKRGQVLILAFAVAAVALMAVVAGGRGGKDDDGGGRDAASTTATAVAQAPSGAVVVTFAYSPEKDALLRPLIARFNASGAQVDGRPVFVRGTSVASGDSELAIAKGTSKPVAWSPASSLWGRLLNFESDRSYVGEENASLVRTPLVIAMWEPMAKALGWPTKKLGFADVLRLARSGAGWGDFGHPEFGDFKLVHTNPDFSTAGLSSVVAEYYSATGKKEGLVEADLPRAREKVKAIESSIVHYGDTTLFIEDQLKKEGPGYASAVAMEEATLVDFNQHRGSQGRLVAIYPREGTFYSDDPYITLDAPWVSAAQKQGSAALEKFLMAQLTPELVARYGFRPGDLDAKPVAPLDASNGVDPGQPERVLGLPEPRVLAALKKAWREDRKPANVLLVLDTSGSMVQEQRLKRAKEGLQGFLAQVQSQDRVGLTVFSDEIRQLVPIGPLSANAARLKQAVAGVNAAGGTKIYDVSAAAVEQVARIADKSRINAVVLLTDGEDTDSDRTADQIVRTLAAQGDSSKRVRVFTIAYSAGAAGAAKTLARIADASGGKSYEGTTSDIESVYRSISSFF